jgi:hypothetical protein
MSRLGKFLLLPSADRWLVSETVLFLALARVAVVVLPFRMVASALGKQSIDLADTSEITEPSPQIDRVRWALRRISCHTPWRSNCLAKAFAGRLMLRRRRIASTVFFGMAKNSDGRLQAHAWLRTGNKALTGGSNLDRYAILAKFTD